jgi:hypothetical protein
LFWNKVLYPNPKIKAESRNKRTFISVSVRFRNIDNFFNT